MVKILKSSIILVEVFDTIIMTVRRIETSKKKVQKIYFFSFKFVEKTINFFQKKRFLPKIPKFQPNI